MSALTPWRFSLIPLFCATGLLGCASGMNLGVSLPIGSNVGLGVSVGTDGRVGVGVGVSSGGGQIGVGTSGQLPVKKPEETTPQK